MEATFRTKVQVSDSPADGTKKEKEEKELEVRRI
jgi:hypothetical protein